MATKVIFKRSVTALLVFLYTFAAGLVFPAQKALAIGPETLRLTLQDAIRLGLQKNPNIKLSQKTYDALSANVGVVESGFYPQIQSSVSYNRATVNYAPSPGFPISGETSENNTNYPFYSAGLSFNQLLFDFGQLSSTLHSSRKSADSADADRRTAAAVLILNVKQSYFGLLQNIQIEKVDEETVHQMEKHLEQAEGFFKVGSKPKFDVTKAQVDLTNAKLTLIKGKNDVQVSRVVLNNALGLPVDTFIEPLDELAYRKEELDLNQAQKSALENRPELASLALKKESSVYNLEFSKRQYFPTLSANGSYMYRNSDFPLIYNWTVAATLSWPIFSGFQTARQVDQAQANVEVSEAQEEIQVQSVLLDVRQAFLNLVAAEEQIATSELVVKQATENLDLAEGRYKAGVGTAIETTDAEVSLSNAKTSAVQALYSFNIAEAELHKAMGVDRP